MEVLLERKWFKPTYTPPIAEEWRDIPGYEGAYSASNMGRIMSLPRITYGGRRWKGRILSQQIVKGYYKTSLYGEHDKKLVSVHRLVALAFLPNPNNYPMINHKDENPLNNNVDNLEWCNASYNVNYGTRIAKYAATRSRVSKGIIPHPEMQKPTAKISLATGEILCVYPSASEAARQCGLLESKISLVCNGKRYTTGGYKWQYITQDGNIS